MDILEHRTAWSKAYHEVFLAHYYATNETKWDIYNRPNNQTAPAGPAVDLAKSRLLLISTAGAYLRDEQEPFDAANDLGDYSIRLFPTSTPFSALAYAHNHYDHTAVNQDAQVLLPLRHLEAMVEEGKIGELTPSVISFSGYQPDIDRVIDEMIPQILQTAKDQQAEAALLVPS